LRPRKKPAHPIRVSVINVTRPPSAIGRDRRDLNESAGEAVSFPQRPSVAEGRFGRDGASRSIPAGFPVPSLRSAMKLRTALHPSRHSTGLPRFINHIDDRSTAFPARRGVSPRPPKSIAGLLRRLKHVFSVRVDGDESRQGRRSAGFSWKPSSHSSAAAL